MKLAVEHKCESIAFPLISSGIYGYPKDEALKVAVSAIKDFLEDHDIDVTLVVFDKLSFVISRELLGAVESYIDEHYVIAHDCKRRELSDEERQVMETILEADEVFSMHNGLFLLEEKFIGPVGEQASLDALIGNLDEPFSQMLLRLIDAKGMTDVQVYKRANLDRRLFSKSEQQRIYAEQAHGYRPHHSIGIIAG